MHQIRFRLGVHPRPRWGAYSAPPDPLAGFKGASLKCGPHDFDPPQSENSSRAPVRPPRYATDQSINQSINQPTEQRAERLLLLIRQSESNSTRSDPRNAQLSVG